MHIIFNETAGNGRAIQKYDVVKKFLHDNGIPFTLDISEYPDHSTQLSKTACERGEQCIVTIGGDGTIREVASGMIYSGVPLGIIPAGTGNDLARVLNIPLDPIEAIKTVLSNNVKTIDGATANGKCFFNVSGLGFDVDVLVAEKKYRKKINGSSSYILGLLRALIKLAPHEISVLCEDESHSFDANAFIALAGNGKYIGGGLKLTPEADLSDGLLDICVISRVSRIKVLPLLMKAVKGRHLDLTVTKYFRAKEITITSKTKQAIQLDGEIIGETPVTYKILPGALEVFC